MSEAKSAQSKLNVLSFPSRSQDEDFKNVPSKSSPTDEIIEDLLNEFGSLINEEEISLEEQLETDEDFLAGQSNAPIGDDPSLPNVFDSIRGQMRHLQESNDRLRFYLDEIESVLGPRK